MLDLTQILQPYQNRRIAIYGLSVMTRELLPQAERECRVIGLLDGCQTSGSFYGKPVISLEKAIEEGVVLILVAARPESCKVITKRVEGVCRAHQIALLDSRGNNLLEQTSKTCDFKGIPGYTKAQLLLDIRRHDVVSVDLFDTLVMRRTLFSSDVFELTDLGLRQKGIVVENFAAKRVDGEKTLSRTMVPTLAEIYAYIREKYQIPELRPEESAELEWSIDCGLLVPRKELCDLLGEIYDAGKPVYIVTDTYYTKPQLVKLLDQCGISRYTDILSSCDFRVSKSTGLFRQLQERISEKNCIHIGDSHDADVLAARAGGLMGWRIYSGLDLFEAVGYFGTWDTLGSLPSRVQAGLFVSRLFNSPFQFEKKEITVSRARDIGYLFFAPVITSFVFWLHRQVQRQDIKHIWFSARDGYLIQKLYAQLDGAVSSTYFLTSRIAATRAALDSREDIRYVEDMRFSGTLQEQLEKRFGIKAAADCLEKTAGGLLAYEEEILEAAAVSRKNYCAYLKRLEIPEGSIAFFDFVARGTVQMFVGRLVETPLKGFYFMQQDPEYMEKWGLSILPFYKKNESNAVAEDYYVLETVLTSSEPSLSGFDSSGGPVYAKETRSAEDIRCIEAVQEGILEYFQSYRELCQEELKERRLGELLLPLVHVVAIADKAFRSLKVEDPFFNRTTALEDLL